jgi:hypothetical protein
MYAWTEKGQISPKTHLELNKFNNGNAFVLSHALLDLVNTCEKIFEAV